MLVKQNFGRKRVTRLMQVARYESVKLKRKYKTTTDSMHQRPKAENLVAAELWCERT